MQSKIFDLLRRKGVRTDTPAGTRIATAIEERRWNHLPPPIAAEARVMFGDEVPALEAKNVAGHDETGPRDDATVNADAGAESSAEDHLASGSPGVGAEPIEIDDLEPLSADAAGSSPRDSATEITQVAEAISSNIDRDERSASIGADPDLTVAELRASEGDEGDGAGSSNGQRANAEPAAGMPGPAIVAPLPGRNQPLSARLHDQHAPGGASVNPQLVGEAVAFALGSLNDGEALSAALYPLENSPSAQAVAQMIETLRPFVAADHPILVMADALKSMAAAQDLVSVIMHRELRQAHAKVATAMELFENGVSPHLRDTIVRDHESERRRIAAE